MVNLKLISLRIDPNVLAKIDVLAKKHSYYKRSSIINNLLNAVINCSDGDTLWRMLSTYRPQEIGYTVDFRIDKKKLDNLPKE